MREEGAIPLILACTNIDEANPFAKEWAILAIRNLCECNPENQALIAALQPQHVQSVPPELRQKGVGVELDAQTGQHQEADGSFTGQTGLACTVGAADCLPILLCHVSGGRATQVGALHAGWRGLAGEAGLGVVEAFFASPAAYGRPPDQWLAWLGPCIGPQAFEVGPEVRAAFLHAGAQAASAFQAAAGGKYLANLPDLARQRLAACGVKHIYGNDARPAWCTVGNPLRFFSYRRERVTGRQVAAIALV